MKRVLWFLVVIEGLYPFPLLACPLCETGANETALFIVTIFGLSILGMSFAFWAYQKNGGLKNSSVNIRNPLDAEKMPNSGDNNE